jgi:multisubunit Na+/H+ antiporter MnhG subunit
MDFLRRMAHAYGALHWSVKATLVAVFALLTTAVGLGMVVFIPADHFVSGRPEPSSWWRKQPFLRGGGLAIKNVLGAILVLLGAIMALPLVPGPGLVFILLGMSLLDFAAKRSIERKLLGIPRVIGFLNDVRARFGRAPLILDDPDEPERPRR